MACLVRKGLGTGREEGKYSTMRPCNYLGKLAPSEISLALLRLLPHVRELASLSREIGIGE